MRDFICRNKAKIITAIASASVMAVSAVPTFAYSPQPIPSDGTLSWSVLGDLWTYVASFTLDVIQIVASQPLMVAMVALPLIGVGVGMFKRLLGA